MPQPADPPLPPGTWPARWIHGTPAGGPVDPFVQVHWYDEHTVVLRQSKDVTFEAPFLYLLLGRERALLLDTGATRDPRTFPLRTIVDDLLGSWTRRWLDPPQRAGYELVVAHSHAHGDHVAGDVLLADRPRTTVVGHQPHEVAEFFGLATWPEGTARFDLGDRALDVVAIPGHHPAHIAVHDPGTGLLLTGDSVYPGRLYVRDAVAFAASTDRLVALAEARGVRAVLGCHLEMTSTAGRDYPLGCRYQPDEPALAMSVDQLRAVRDAAHRFANSPGVHRFDTFILWIGPCWSAVAWHLLRLLGWRLRRGGRRLRRRH
jgi:glyoxylase-like metal-dependent hydrolase (beta-lactamase superfamily II)